MPLSRVLVEGPTTIIALNHVLALLIWYLVSKLSDFQLNRLVFVHVWIFFKLMDLFA